MSGELILTLKKETLQKKRIPWEKENKVSVMIGLLCRNSYICGPRNPNAYEILGTCPRIFERQYLKMQHAWKTVGSSILFCSNGALYHCVFYYTQKMSQK